MHAGTLGLLDDPAGDVLESATQGGDVPALEVRETQDTLDDRPVQTGAAAANVWTNERKITIDDPEIRTRNVETLETAYSEWIAEVTGSGIVLAASIATDDERSPFPFDLFTAQTGQRCERYAIDVNRLSDRWAEDDVLTDVWMVAKEDEFDEGVSIDYGENASLDDVTEASIGLGFERTFSGSETKGVVFDGGYVACYRDWPPSKVIRFVEHELLPYAWEYVPDDNQVDFEEVFG